MMRITFGLINSFNFGSLNCLFWCPLKVLSVPLKCLLLSHSYRNDSTKCPHSSFALMEVKSSLKWAGTESPFFQKSIFSTRANQTAFRACLIKGDLVGRERASEWAFSELWLPAFAKMFVRECLFSRYLTMILLMLSKICYFLSNSSS